MTITIFMSIRIIISTNRNNRMVQACRLPLQERRLKFVSVRLLFPAQNSSNSANHVLGQINEISLVTLSVHSVHRRQIVPTITRDHFCLDMAEQRLG